MFIEQLLSARPPECGCQDEKATDPALGELTVAEEHQAQDAEVDVAEARTGHSGRTEDRGGRREEGLPAQPRGVNSGLCRLRPEGQLLRGERDLPWEGALQARARGNKCRGGSDLRMRGLHDGSMKPLQLRSWPLNPSLRPENAGRGTSWGTCPSPSPLSSRPWGPPQTAHPGHSGLGILVPGPVMSSCGRTSSCNEICHQSCWAALCQAADACWDRDQCGRAGRGVRWVHT